MAGDIEERTVQVLSHTVKVSSYEYDKNRRFTVEAGTRASNVLVQFGGGNGYRVGVQNAAMEAAVTEWERRWGALPWDLAQFMVMHLSCQVLVELRVEPR